MLSDWLSLLVATDFYPESKLRELEPYGISYDREAGQLASHLETDTPYITYGRLASVPRMTERELIRECHALGFEPRFEMRGLPYVVFGFSIVASVWSLLRPITLERPPSTYERDPERKALTDITAIRRFGY